MQQGRFQDRRQADLEISKRQLGEPVLVGNDLALLGELELGIDRAECLGHDGVSGRTASPAHRAAAAVEEAQLDAVSSSYVTNRPGGLVELPL